MDSITCKTQLRANTGNVEDGRSVQCSTCSGPGSTFRDGARAAKISRPSPQAAGTHCDLVNTAANIIDISDQTGLCNTRIGLMHMHGRASRCAALDVAGPLAVAGPSRRCLTIMLFAYARHVKCMHERCDASPRIPVVFVASPSFFCYHSLACSIFYIQNTKSCQLRNMGMLIPKDEQLHFISSTRTKVTGSFCRKPVKCSISGSYLSY